MPPTNCDDEGDQNSKASLEDFKMFAHWKVADEQTDPKGFLRKIYLKQHTSIGRLLKLEKGTPFSRGSSSISSVNGCEPWREKFDGGDMTSVERRNEALELFGGEIQAATEGTKMWRLRCINDEPAVTRTRTTRARSRGTTTTTTRTTTTTTRTRTRTRRTGAAQTRGRARTRRTSKKTRKTAAAQAAAGAFIRGGTGRKTGATTGAKKSQQEARTSTNHNQ